MMVQVSHSSYAKMHTIGGLQYKPSHPALQAKSKTLSPKPDPKRLEALPKQ
jgi:hypothetical protein